MTAIILPFFYNLYVLEFNRMQKLMNNNFKIKYPILITCFFLVYGDLKAESAQSIKDELEMCVSCHGDKGASENPEVPILAGQHFYYLYVQLKDYKSRARENEIMSEIASTLSKPKMKELAQYFSKQSWPNIGFKASDKKTALGERAASAGQCVQCHLGSYKGDSRIPRLSGQHPLYLYTTMIDFKNKKRLNSPAKGSLFSSYPEAEIEAMSEFLAGM